MQEINWWAAEKKYRTRKWRKYIVYPGIYQPCDIDSQFHQMSHNFHPKAITNVAQIIVDVKV